MKQLFARHWASGKRGCWLLKDEKKSKAGLTIVQLTTGIEFPVVGPALLFSHLSVTIYTLFGLVCFWWEGNSIPRYYILAEIEPPHCNFNCNFK